MLRPEKWQNHHDREVKEPDMWAGYSKYWQKVGFAHTPVWMRSRLLQSGEAWGVCLWKPVRSCWSELSFRSVASGKVHSTLRPPQLPPEPGPPRLPVQISFSGMLWHLCRFLEGLLTALFPASFIRFEAEVSSFINRILATLDYFWAPPLFQAQSVGDTTAMSSKCWPQWSFYPERKGGES